MFSTRRSSRERESGGHFPPVPVQSYQRHTPLPPPKKKKKSLFCQTHGFIASVLGLVGTSGSALCSLSSMFPQLCSLSSMFPHVIFIINSRLTTGQFNYCLTTGHSDHCLTTGHSDHCLTNDHSDHCLNIVTLTIA